MRILETIQQMPETAVTIGVFDGVHRGHQSLLAETIAVAKQENLLAAALTFDPHPSALFSPARTPLLLGTLEERAALLTQHGIDEVIIAPFDRSLAALTPEEFVRGILCERLQARVVIVGDDFRFGCDRRGDVAYLKQAGEKYGFRTVVVPPVFVEGMPARSTAIRLMLVGGRVEPAEQLLGRPYSLSGTVVHGRKLGRTIGFPTANLETALGLLIPGAGVYAGEAITEAPVSYPAALSIGTNPTVTPGVDAPRTVEAYLLDFEGDLYDQPLRLVFRHFLRGTEKFSSLDALVEQIRQDVITTKRLICG